MMRRQIPLLIIFVSGFVMIIDYFFPAVPHIRGYRQIFLNWGRVAVTFAMLLGVFSLLISNLRKVALQQAGWIFNMILLISFAITFFFAVKYKIAVSGNTVTTIKGTQVGQTGYWIFQTIYTPLSSSIFALVAFFIASAAFRAFRAKNIESILLLSAAILVMLGSIPLGGLFFHAAYVDPILTWFFYQIQIIPMSAAQRAINFGAAIGMVFMSIKILTGIDRSYFGGDQ